MPTIQERIKHITATIPTNVRLVAVSKYQPEEFILDAYSAGVSSESLSAKISGKWFAVAVTVIGTAGAVFLPLADITGFLYFIGSVFAPMIAIQIADFFILKQSRETSLFNSTNLLIWIVGFIVYRLLMRIDIVVGNTFPDMLITIVLCVVVSNRTHHYRIKKY